MDNSLSKVNQISHLATKSVDEKDQFIAKAE